MAYKEKLYKISKDGYSFEKVHEISCSNLPDMFSEKGKELYKSLGRGTNILQTQDQLDKYMQAFGNKHYIKFLNLFKSMPTSVFEEVFDFVDWGCGIGLAILAFADFLKKTLNRDVESKIREITLIEPSQVALERACLHAEYLFPESKIKGINKNFQSLTEDDFKGFGTVPRIHLFSNVMDLDVFDDRKMLSEFLRKVRRSAFGLDEYFICISPTYKSVRNTFDQFIRNIADSNEFKITAIKEPFEMEFFKENNQRFATMTARLDRIQSKEIIRLWSEISNPKLVEALNLHRDSTHGQRKLVEFVAKQTTEKEHDILYCPNLMGDTPDMLILKRNHKALLILVCDTSEQEGIVKAARYIEDIKSNIFRLHAKNLLRKNIHDERAYGSITTVVFFPSFNTDKLKSKKMQCIEKDKKLFKYVEFLCPDSLLNFQWSSYIDDEIYFELKNLRNPIGVASKPELINFDNFQIKLVASEWSCQKKISGLVGSGKTTVLVNRAISAYKRTHKQVLILTYNITLRNYIEQMIQNKFGFFTRDQFYVVNFHEFVSAEIRYSIFSFELDAEFKWIQYDDFKSFEKLMEHVNKFRKYESILIDEVQDYKYIWLEMIKKVFLADDGEYVLFGDEKQNIYQRELDKRKMHTNIPGVFTQLKKCHRSNEALLKCVELFQEKVMKVRYDVDENIVGNELGLEWNYENKKGFIRYRDIQSRDVGEVVRVLLEMVHKQYHVPYAQITVVGCSISFLRRCDKEFRRKTGLDTECMFESQEEFKTIMDDGNLKGTKKERKIKEIRRSRKLHFNGMADMIKFSTIHSYKGWESDAIVELVEPNDAESNGLEQEEDTNFELIYTGFTRAKKNLFILNCGSETYNDALSEIFTQAE